MAVTAVIFVITAIIFFSIAMQSPVASANTVIRGDIYVNTPKQGIVLDNPAILGSQDFIFKTSNSSIFKKETNYKQHASFTRAVTFNTTASSLSTYKDCFSMRWNNVGTDQNGKRIDVKIVCAQLDILHQYKGQGSYTQSPSRTCLIGQTGTYLDAAPYWYWYIKAKYAFYAYETGTDIPASGDFLTEVKDIDCAELWVKNGSSYVTDYNSEWAETTKLEDRNSNIYITQNNFLNITNNGTWLKPTKGDSDTYDSGAVFYLSSNGGTITWSGNNTSATILFYSFQPHYIEATKGTGGSITKEGKTIVGWKNEPTYTATASKNYKIKSVTVDGKAVSVPANSKTFSYTFAPVIADHTIDVQFEPIKVNLSYDKNLPTATGTTAGVVNANAGSQATIANNGFIAEGHTFTGWNTSPDGTGIAYAPGDQFVLGESNTVLYAQWNPNIYTVTWIDSITGEPFHAESVPHGNAATLPDLPVHEGFTALLPALGNDNVLLSNITEDKTFRIEYERNTYSISVDYISKSAGREISPSIHLEIPYGDPFTISTYISDNYIFLPDLMEITNSNTQQPLVDIVFENENDNTIHCDNMPANNLHIVLVYDTWIQMPETGSLNLSLLIFCGAAILCTSIAVPILRNRPSS